MRDATESNEDRLARRRARRWQRRLGLFAPFLAVPGVLIVLMLSVDLIEHRPDARERARTAERAPKPAPRVAPASGPLATAPTSGTDARDVGLEAGALASAHALSPASVIADAVGADMPLAPGVAATTSDAALFDAPAPTTSVGDARREAR